VNQKTWGPFTGAQLAAMFIAVVFALAVPGALFAAIGQYVAIQDPPSGRNAAVLKGNALKVNGVEAAPEKPFFASVSIPNYYLNFQQSPVLQTTATLALNRIHISHESRVSNLWSGAVWAQLPCGSSFKRLAVFSLNSGEMNTDAFVTPIVLTPPAGQSLCISATFGPIDGSTSDPGQMYVDVSGFVVSGNFTPSATPKIAKRPTG